MSKRRKRKPPHLLTSTQHVPAYYIVAWHWGNGEDCIPEVLDRTLPSRAKALDRINRLERHQATDHPWDASGDYPAQPVYCVYSYRDMVAMHLIAERAEAGEPNENTPSSA